MTTGEQLEANASAAAHLETIVSNMGTSKQGHLCIYCGKLYSRKYGLKIHIRTHTGFKPLKCKYCARPFGDPSNLNKHVRLHVQGNTIYKCNECDKILVRRRDLQRHMQARHSGPGGGGGEAAGEGTSSQKSMTTYSSCSDDNIDDDDDEDGGSSRRSGVLSVMDSSEEDDVRMQWLLLLETDFYTKYFFYCKYK